MASCKEKVNEINARRTEAEGDTRNNMPFGIAHPSPNVMFLTVTFNQAWAQLNSTLTQLLGVYFPCWRQHFLRCPFIAK